MWSVFLVMKIFPTALHLALKLYKLVIFYFYLGKNSSNVA